MDELDFHEDMEGVFSSENSSLTKEDIRSMMEEKGIVYNESFSNFMQSAFGE